MAKPKRVPAGLVQWVTRQSRATAYHRGQHVSKEGVIGVTDGAMLIFPRFPLNEKDVPVTTGADSFWNHSGTAYECLKTCQKTESRDASAPWIDVRPEDIMSIARQFGRFFAGLDEVFCNFNIDAATREMGFDCKAFEDRGTRIIDALDIGPKSGSLSIGLDRAKHLFNNVGNRCTIGIGNIGYTDVLTVVTEHLGAALMPMIEK